MSKTEFLFVVAGASPPRASFRFRDDKNIIVSTLDECDFTVSKTEIMVSGPQGWKGVVDYAQKKAIREDNRN